MRKTKSWKLVFQFHDIPIIRNKFNIVFGVPKLNNVKFRFNCKNIDIIL